MSKKSMKFHAHKVVRVMTKECAVHSIGQAGFCLVTIVAMQEDAVQYKKEVTFWNHHFDGTPKLFGLLCLV